MMTTKTRPGTICQRPSRRSPIIVICGNRQDGRQALPCLRRLWDLERIKILSTGQSLHQPACETKRHHLMATVSRRGEDGFKYRRPPAQVGSTQGMWIILFSFSLIHFVNSPRTHCGLCLKSWSLFNLLSLLNRSNPLNYIRVFLHSTTMPLFLNAAKNGKRFHWKVKGNRETRNDNRILDDNN